MGKRWTESDDLFLVEFYDAIGPEIGPHDLGRSRTATKARVKKLKESGAWEAYRAATCNRLRALNLAGHITTEFQRDLVREALDEKSSQIAIVGGGNG